MKRHRLFVFAISTVFANVIFALPLMAQCAAPVPVMAICTYPGGCGAPGNGFNATRPNDLKLVRKYKTCMGATSDISESMVNKRNRCASAAGVRFVNGDEYDGPLVSDVDGRPTNRDAIGHALAVADPMRQLEHAQSIAPTCSAPLAILNNVGVLITFASVVASIGIGFPEHWRRFVIIIPTALLPAAMGFLWALMQLRNKRGRMQNLFDAMPSNPFAAGQYPKGRGNVELRTNRELHINRTPSLANWRSMCKIRQMTTLVWELSEFARLYVPIERVGS